MSMLNDVMLFDAYDVIIAISTCKIEDIPKNYIFQRT